MVARDAGLSGQARPAGGRGPAALDSSPLGSWYAAHGRHDLPWRATTDRWSVLVAEVMLQQTHVARVLPAWPAFLERFPDPATAAGHSPAEVIAAWGRLGYPRRARRLWEAAGVVARTGWPVDLSLLPGVGRYTAAAVAAQADGVDVPAVDVNVRRVVERVDGRALGPAGAEEASRRLGAPLVGRHRLLALMDLGALVCRPARPRCGACPLSPGCAEAGGPAGAGGPRRRSPRAPAYEGSFRQRRGGVLARLREGPVEARSLDAEALRSLVADGLAEVEDGRARLPRR